MLATSCSAPSVSQKLGVSQIQISSKLPSPILLVSILIGYISFVIDFAPPLITTFAKSPYNYFSGK
jgi:hypothetical protein